MEPQQNLLQQLFGIEGELLHVIVPVSILDHIVQVGENGERCRLHCFEVRVIRQTPVCIQPLQHQFDGVDMPVGKILIGLKEVFQKRDVLGESCLLTESCRGILIAVAIQIPEFRLQRIDAVLTAHQIHKATTQPITQVDKLMLRIQTDHRLSRLQNVAGQQFQQIAFALTTVAQNKDAGCGFVIGSLIQIDNDVGAIAVFPDIESMGIGFAAVVEREQIGNGTDRQDSFELGAEDITSRRICGKKALPLLQQDAVCSHLCAGQFCNHFITQSAQAIGILCGQFNEHGAMYQRLVIAGVVGNHGDHVL